MKDNNIYEPKKKSRIPKIVIAVVFIILILVTAGDCFYTVKETDTVIITTFGKAKIVEEKGLHFKLPYIQHAYSIDTTIQSFTIGYVNTSDGDMVEVPEESLMITSDYNLIDVDFYVNYKVSDPYKAFYATSDPESILKNICMANIRNVISAYTVDAALTTGKAEIQSNIRQLVLKELETQDIGLSLVDISMQDAEAPEENVVLAFKEVETAKQQKESEINNANQYRNEQIPAAEAKADAVVQKAEAEKTERENDAVNQVAKFNAQYQEYQKFPGITKRRMFYEAMQDILPTMKVIINDGKGDVQKIYPVESFQSFDSTDFNQNQEKLNENEKEAE